MMPQTMVEAARAEMDASSTCRCAACGHDTAHGVAVFCCHPRCSQVTPAGQLTICLQRKKHNHLCMACAGGEKK